MARIIVDDFSNATENANVSDQIFVGNDINPIPSGTWFPLFNNGAYYIDADINAYEDVPGLAVERQVDSLRVVLHGSLGNKDIEHIDGVVEFYNASVDEVRSDPVKYNGLENWKDNKKLLLPRNDEVDNMGDSVDYWLTTNTLDDGFFADWGITEDCIDECTYSIDGYKINALTEEPIAGWMIELKNASGTASTTLTDSEGYYSFENLCADEYTVHEASSLVWEQIAPVDPNFYTRIFSSVKAPTAVVNQKSKSNGGGHLYGDFVNQPLICGYKYNAKTEAGIDEWMIYLEEMRECTDGEQWADEVISYDTNGTVITDNRRTDPEKTLNEAQDDDTYNFYSLGLGGELVLAFDNMIINGEGDDLKVYETTFNNKTCSEYPEKINVYASQNGEDGTWVFLGGPDCQEGDSFFDLGSLEWAQYVKIVDVSENSGDGYDVDAVEALHCASWEIVDETQTKDGGHYCFDAPIGEYRIHEEERTEEGWTAVVGPYSEVFEFDGTEPYTFDFINTPPSPSLEVCKYNENEDFINGWMMEVYSSENLVTNGDFEYPVVLDNNGRWELFNSDETDWNILWMDDSLDDIPVIEFQTSSLWTPSTGNQYAELDSHNSSKKSSTIIDQDIITIPGNKYRLSFAFSPRPGVEDNKLKVEFGSVDMTYDKSGLGESDTNWEVYEYTIIADSNSTNLKFSDYSNPDALGTFLDSVSVYEMVVEGETEDEGCIVFDDIDFGDYMVFEENRDNWTREYPEEEHHDVSLTKNNLFESVYFINSYYNPEPKYGLLRVCQFEDSDGVMPTDGTPATSTEWVFTVNSQTATTSLGNHCVNFELPLGDHTISRNLNPGWFDLDPSDAQKTVTVYPGTNEIDFYSTQYSFISGYLYEEDESVNTPIEGAVVALFKIGEPDQQIGTTSTSATGWYGFSHLLPGSYYVETENPEGTSRTETPPNPITVAGGGASCGNNFIFSIAGENEEEGCGDGIIQKYLGENCDDGNTVSGDKCSSSCRKEGGRTPVIFSGKKSGPFILGVDAEVSLAINITVDKNPVLRGDILNYTILVTNNGLLEAITASVMNDLPDGLTFNDNGDKSRIFDLGNIASGEVKTITYEALVADDVLAGDLVNTAQAAAVNYPDSPVEDSVTVLVEVPEVKGVEYTIPDTGFSIMEFMVIVFSALTLFFMAGALRKRYIA